MPKKIGTTIPANKVKTNPVPSPGNKKPGSRKGSGGNKSVNGTPGRG